MKRSTVCYLLAGITVCTTILIGNVVESGIETFVVYGLGLLFVNLFDKKGDEYLSHEKNLP